MTVPEVSLVAVMQPPLDPLAAAFQVTLFPNATSAQSHFTGYSTDFRNADYNDFNAVFWYLALLGGGVTMNAMSGKITRYAFSSEDGDLVKA